MASKSEVLNPEYRARALGNPYDNRGFRWHGLVVFLLVGAAIVAGVASTAL